MRKIDTSEKLKIVLASKVLCKLTFQEIDFTDWENKLLERKVQKCLFLNCNIPQKLLNHLYYENYIFPHLDVPYNVYPSELYHKDTLYKGYNPQKPETYLQTPDKIVYDYYKRMGAETTNITETLARTLHDHSIDDEMNEFLAHYDEKRVVAIMGGHRLSRTDKMYEKVALLSKRLTERGYLMSSGGGPGAMEATHLGAWLAGKSEQTLQKAIGILAAAPLYSHSGWLKSAYAVITQYPNPVFQSLGIPTWLYGHELSTPFATHIAKFFENSLREEGLLAIAKGGVIFAPGSAGTMQEIFQDLAQNHYASYGYASPMVFLDVHYWTHQRPIFPLINTMVEKGDLSSEVNLEINDDVTQIIKHIEKFTNS